MRLRSDLDLGPRIQVVVSNQQRSGLEQPEVWFVDLEAWKADNPGKAVPPPEERTWELIKGKWTEGVSYLNLCFIDFYCFYRVLLLYK